MTKKDISMYDWSEFAVGTTDKELLWKIAANSSWVLPQLMAFIGTNFRIAKIDEKYSFLESLKATAKAANNNEIYFSDGKLAELDAIKGIINFLKHTPRGDILGSMKQIVVPRYSAAVPLFLSALKEYRKVQYSSWNWSEEEKSYLVDQGILSMSEYFGKPVEFSKEKLLNFREVGRTIKSGNKTGVKKRVEVAFSITGIQDPEFSPLPSLMKTLLCQTWVYHPSIRHELAITNLEDIDSPAEPLIEEDLVPRAPEIKVQKQMDWPI